MISGWQVVSEAWGGEMRVSTWAVYVEFDGADADEQTCEQLTEQLVPAFPDGGVSVGLERHRGGRLSVQVAVDVPDTLGARAWRRALNDVTEAAVRGLRGLNRSAEIIDVQVTRWEEFERRLLQPVVPELITLSDAARLAGISHQRMHQVAEGHPDFPPVVVAGTSLRVRRAVEAFLASWERRPGRRSPAAPSRPAPTGSAAPHLEPRRRADAGGTEES